MLRKGHGAGAGVPRIEVAPADELPSASPAVTVRVDRDANGRFRPGNDVARSKRLRPGPRGCAGLDTTAPEYRSFLRWGQRYASRRRAELARLHGGELSDGCAAIVESAAEALAASRFIQWKASQGGDPALFKQASALASTARQHELAAWELAAREAKGRPSKEDKAWAELLSGGKK